MLAPGSTIGILGGGQLARMMALAAAPLGFRVHILAPESDCPAADVSAFHLCADYTNEAALEQFAGGVDAVTYEFENVPLVAARILANRVPIWPDPHALAVSQDRLVEKQFLNRSGLATAPFEPIDHADQIPLALVRLGLPAILKTRRMGYDGKGQVLIRSADEAARAFAAIGQSPAVLEGFVSFQREISVIAARAISGQIACYDPAWNRHDDHILRQSLIPSGCGPEIESDALAKAKKIAEALNYVGVLGIEFFVTADGLLINEIAPRVHNSGHWTIDGCALSQFEQHIRCVAGWPLGPVIRHADAIMDNLIGDDVLNWAELAHDPTARLHLYAKGSPRPGRKMGHVTRLYPIGQRPE